MAQNATAVITKARTMYGKMLSPAQYDDLLRRQSVQEISAYLRERTTYATTLEGVQDSTVHRGQLENLLRKDLFYQYIKLMKYVPKGDTVYKCIIMDMEISVILSCLRNIISRREDDLLAALPTFIQPYASFRLFDLVGVKTVEQVYTALENTDYGPVLRYCIEHYPLAEGGRLRFTHFEVALRTFYFRTLLERADSSRGMSGDQLREVLTLRAELTNIETICRIKYNFDKEPEAIRELLLPFHCKLKRRELDDLIEAKDLPAFMQRLSQTCYGPDISQNGKYIDIEMGIIRYRLNRRLMRFSTDPQVVYISFMMLRGMETENLCRIIEGVRYKLPPEKIEHLLYKA